MVRVRGKPSSLLGRSQVALLANLLGDVPPSLVVQARSSHDLGDLRGDFGFRLFVLRCESGGVFGHDRYSWWAKTLVLFRGPSVVRNRLWSLFRPCRWRKTFRTRSPWSIPRRPFGYKAATRLIDRLGRRGQSQPLQCIEQVGMVGFPLFGLLSLRRRGAFSSACG